MTAAQRGLRLALWIQSELVVIMTDLGELVGGHTRSTCCSASRWSGLHRGGLRARGAGTADQRVRRDPPGAAHALRTIVVLLVARVIVAGVDEPALVRGLVPQPLDGSAALLAVGFIGATVMPHALHFHSAVAREDSRPKDAAKLAAAARSKRAIAIATSCAAVASVSLVLIAARLPTEASGGLTEAYAAIGDVLGQIAAVGFGLALLASGLSSTIVGIYTGQVVMQGFWRRRIALWLRRLLAVLPPLVILMLGVDPTTALVFSQVVLSFGLPTNLIPLVLLTSQRAVMGRLVNARVTNVLAGLATTVICALDVYLLVDMFSG